MRLCLHDKVWRFERTMSLFARGAMAARQVLTLKIEVRVLAGEPLLVSDQVSAVVAA